jgi:hypothetical protein
MFENKAQEWLCSAHLFFTKLGGPLIFEQTRY